MLKTRQIPHIQNRRPLILLILAATLILVLILSATAYALLGDGPLQGQEAAVMTKTSSPALPPTLPVLPPVEAKVRLLVPHNLQANSRATISGTVSIPRSSPTTVQGKQIVSVQRKERNRWLPLRHVEIFHGRFKASIALNHPGALTLRATIITRSLPPVHGTSAITTRHVAKQPIQLHTVVASFYTDYGLPTACGGTLGSNEIGVADKVLPCGTMILLVYHGRRMTVPVIDRGPYVAGRTYDLSGALAAAIGFDESKGFDNIQTNIDAG